MYLAVCGSCVCVCVSVKPRKLPVVDVCAAFACVFVCTSVRARACVYMYVCVCVFVPSWSLHLIPLRFAPLCCAGAVWVGRPHQVSWGLPATPRGPLLWPFLGLHVSLCGPSRDAVYIFHLISTCTTHYTLSAWHGADADGLWRSVVVSIAPHREPVDTETLVWII